MICSKHLLSPLSRCAASPTANHSYSCTECHECHVAQPGALCDRRSTLGAVRPPPHHNRHVGQQERTCSLLLAAALMQDSQDSQDSEGAPSLAPSSPVRLSACTQHGDPGDRSLPWVLPDLPLSITLRRGEPHREYQRTHISRTLHFPRPRSRVQSPEDDD